MPVKVTVPKPGVNVPPLFVQLPATFVEDPAVSVVPVAMETSPDTLRVAGAVKLPVVRVRSFTPRVVRLEVSSRVPAVFKTVRLLNAWLKEVPLIA